MTTPQNSIEISVFPSGPLETNGYLVVDKKTNQAAIIDAPPDVTEKILQKAQREQLTVAMLLLTHSHWDHIADAALLKNKFSIPVLIHEEDASNLIEPGKDRLPCWLAIDSVTPSRLLKEGDSLSIGKSNWQVIHTPGHSPGSICLYCKEEALLLSGDTLFKSSIGNLSLPTSEPERMWPSLKKLSNLPPETKVFPGHGTSTTIGQEKWLSKAEEIFG